MKMIYKHPHQRILMKINPVLCCKHTTSPCYDGFHNLYDGCLSNHPSFLLSVQTNHHHFQNLFHLLPFPSNQCPLEEVHSLVCPGQVRLLVSCVVHTSHRRSWWEGWGNQTQTLVPVVKANTLVKKTQTFTAVTTSHYDELKNRLFPFVIRRSYT